MTTGSRIEACQRNYNVSRRPTEKMYVILAAGQRMVVEPSLNPRHIYEEGSYQAWRVAPGKIRDISIPRDSGCIADIAYRSVEQSK